MDAGREDESVRLPTQQYLYRFADAEFDESRSQLRVGGEPVAMEPKPLLLLAELLRRVNEVVTKDELLEWVWDGRPTVENVLANAVLKLRKALGPQAAERIVTVPRLGYRLVGPIERIAVGQVAAPDPDLKPGLAVPHRESYQLVRCLGRGRVARVWLARHTKLPHQRVFKFATDAEGLRTLKREYTLARLLHAELGDRPDFLPVQDANLAESPFFLEYEWGGTDLASWAEEDDRLAGMPRAARLALFLDIAQAVAAAHSVGVLHKDLKPANVLVSAGERAGSWQVRLIDFGSALALQPERLQGLGLTALGLTTSISPDADGLAATPLYLAPEVLSGQAFTVQADVYVLGVLLFQMLVGDLRLTMAPGWERRIDDDLLCADIAAATDGSPAARLASVAELMSRLVQLEQRRAQRQQAGELAMRMDGLLQDQRKRAARRPWILASSAALLLGLLGSGWFSWQADRARSEAQAQTRRAEAINDFLNRDVLPSADITRAGSARALTMGDVIQRAADRAAQRFADQPLTEAMVRCQLGEIQMRGVRAADAVRQYERGIALLEKGTLPDDPALLVCRFGLAEALSLDYRVPEAEVQLARAQAAAKARLAEGHLPLRIAEASAQHAVLTKLKKHQDALLAAQRLVAETDRLPQAALSDRFTAHARLAESYLMLGDEAHARPVLESLMKPPYSAENVGAVSHANAQVALSQTLLSQGRLDDALGLLLPAREVLGAALGPLAYHVGLVNFNLAQAYSLKPDSASAIDCLRLALQAFSASLGPEHGHVISVKANLAISELNLGHAEPAVQALAQVIPIYRSKGFPVDALQFYQAMGLNSLGRWRQALELLDALDVARLVQAHVDDTPDGGPQAYAWRAAAERGRALIGVGQRRAGEAMLRQALADMQRGGAPQEWIKAYRNDLRNGTRP